MNGTFGYFLLLIQSAHTTTDHTTTNSSSLVGLVATKLHACYLLGGAG